MDTFYREQKPPFIRGRPLGAKVVRDIGKGSYGTVREYSVDPSVVVLFGLTPGDNVAIKRIKDDIPEGISSSAVRELHCLQKLNGVPNILKLMGASLEISSTGFSIVELITPIYSSDMSKFIKVVPTMERIKYYNSCFAQIARGLRYIYDAGIVHRDIKPGNILVTYEYDTVNNELKYKPICHIADFGLACQMECDSRKRNTAMDNNNVYSTQFRPPEVAADMDYDDRSDMWAFGITMMCYLCNAYPLHILNDDTNNEILTTIFISCKTPMDFDSDAYDLLKIHSVGTNINVERILSNSLTPLHYSFIPKDVIRRLENMLMIDMPDRLRIDTLVSKIDTKMGKFRMPRIDSILMMDDQIEKYREISSIIQQTVIAMKADIALFFYSMDVFNRHVNAIYRSTEKYHTVAWTCIILVAKMLEIELSITDVVHLSSGKSTALEIKRTEIEICEHLNYLLLSCELDDIITFIRGIDSTDHQELVQHIFNKLVEEDEIYIHKSYAEILRMLQDYSKP